ncbi:TylF/MycF/NovP-related O-methyltransferase [Candidatus Pelagibacter sp. HIMB1748]|uniref:TylF/MycF/NovP-related O-methyltransferase n=1 Tax=unclassified Candidatus Pelagibacter TaxID=2647897 RepID=UPI003F82CCB5
MINALKSLISKALGKMGYSVINHNQKIVELSKKDDELINLVKNYSMTPKIRIYNLLQALRHIKIKKIEGDYVECGVWKGGNILLFKKFLENEDSSLRNIYAFDTFQGMTDPDENDIEISSKDTATKLLQKDKNKKTNVWGICSLDQVKKNISKHTKDLRNIYFVKGAVEKTLNENKNIPEKISLLRLDTDWYQSTKKELEVLYKKVSIGGIIIIDDYGHWGGSKKAVDEFFSDKFVWMHYVDYACRLIIKD